MSAFAVAPTSRFAVAFALLLVYVVWGSTYLAIRLALQGGALPLTMVSGGRFLVAGGVLYLLLRWRGVSAPSRRQWANLWVMGATLLLFGTGMVVMAERSVSSSLAATSIASVPLWMALFSSLRGRSFSRGEWTGVVIGFFGVLWLNVGGSLIATPGGLVMLLLAPIGWAFGSVWSTGRDLPSPFMTAAGQMLCGGLLLVVIGLSSGERPVALPSSAGMAALVYLCVFGSIVAFTAYVWLLSHVRTALASSYAYVNPVIAVALGVWLGNEHLNPHDFGAMAVILTGVAVVTLTRKRH